MLLFLKEDEKLGVNSVRAEKLSLIKSNRSISWANDLFSVSDGKESACNAGDPSSIPPVFLSGECYGQRSLVGYNPWGHKELDMTKHSTAAKVPGGLNN